LEKLITELKVSISITSNTAFVDAKYIHKTIQEAEMDSLFSFMLFSDELGVGKPHEEVFKTIKLSALKLKPDLEYNQIMHVGDDYDFDFRPARTFGLNAYLFKL
jgi:FMN phosphatase YigB (HAD superfamily)